MSNADIEVKKTNHLTSKNILQFQDDFIAYGKTFQKADAAAVTVDGKKIIKAGTIYPTNDGSAIGVVLEDVDVTNGAAVGALVVSGSLNENKVPTKPSNTAKKALPRIVWFPTVTHPAA